MIFQTIYSINYASRPKGLRSKRRSFSCIFQEVQSLSIRTFLVLLSLPTLAQTVPTLTFYCNVSSIVIVTRGKNGINHMVINHNKSTNVQYMDPVTLLIRPRKDFSSWQQNLNIIFPVGKPKTFDIARFQIECCTTTINLYT